MVGNDEPLQPFHLVSHLLVGLHLTHIDIRLVVVEERPHLQHVDSIANLDVDIEIADREIHEVIACHLIEELVFIQAVMLVSHNEDMDIVALGSERRVGKRRVALNKESGSAVPNGAHLHLSARENTSFAHTLDIKSGKLADGALRVFIHDSFHEVQELAPASQLKLAHRLEEHESGLVGSLRIPLLCCL